MRDAVQVAIALSSMDDELLHGPSPAKAAKKNRNLHPAHLALPPPTPLLPALTLSAGEYRVSGGELKVSRQVGLPRNPTRSSPEARLKAPVVSP
jgi:hypothetical protein